MRPADCDVNTGIDGKDLGQHDRLARECRGEHGIVRTLLGEHDVVYLQAGTERPELFGELRHALARPGPGAYLRDARLIDVDDDDAAFFRVGGRGGGNPRARTGRPRVLPWRAMPRAHSR